jgi:branched-chain amino acid transport system substrate-binding protein
VRLAKLLVPLPIVLAMTTGAAPAYAEVRIGLAAALTGPMAWGGEQAARGADVAVADLNANGGVLGEQIELITADDYCEPGQAVAAANKLVAAAVVGCSVTNAPALRSRHPTSMRRPAFS